MVEDSSAPMAFYLAIASVANLTFLGRSVLDNIDNPKNQTVGRRRFLLFLSMTELAWVVPCFVQCFIVFVDGTDGAWSPKQESSGCDLQGFYSVFSASSGQMMGVVAAYLTLQATKQKDAAGPMVTFSCLAVSAASLLIALLPFMGVGEYKYSGEGFCYYDWYNDTHSSITFIVGLLCVSCGTAMFLMASSDLRLLMFPIAFVVGWFLWPIASMISLADGTIPDHMLLTGAILGHMQALLNPVIYGIIWRGMFIETEEPACLATATTLVASTPVASYGCDLKKGDKQEVSGVVPVHVADDVEAQHYPSKQAADVSQQKDVVNSG